ncbi:MAG: hypothetical protein WC934_02985, partial [Acidithiobacillus sp.]|uniref:hypothetical protein n=1 Tax=Acidithiobacillus sp. TaxID=1872118 RepID=UPI00355EEDF4
MVLLSLLDLDCQIQYLIYKYQPITMINLLHHFHPSILEKISNTIHSLQIGAIIGLNENAIKIINLEKSPFLRILHCIYTQETPLTRTEIRNNIKHKQVTQILDKLLQSQIIYEYRTEFSKGNYIFPTDQKETSISQLNKNIIEKLEQSHTTHDQC